MLYREVIAVCSYTHTEHTNALCGQNVELLNVKLGRTSSNRYAVQAQKAIMPKYLGQSWRIFVRSLVQNVHKFRRNIFAYQWEV